MKKYVFTMIVGILVGWAIVSNAQTIDLATIEVKPDVTQYEITDLIIHQNTKQAIVTIAKGYLDGETFIQVEEFTTIFQDDETDKAYTQFLSDIGIKSALVKTALKTKLGK